MRPAREPRATESVPAYEAGALVSIWFDADRSCAQALSECSCRHCLCRMTFSRTPRSLNVRWGLCIS